MKTHPTLKMTFFLIFLLLMFNQCTPQNKSSNQVLPAASAVQGKPVGGHCDGCQLMYIDMPTYISSTDTSDGWFEGGKKLIIKGTAYALNGKSPVPGVIVYYYHTDTKGNYSPGNGISNEAKRHGHLRGWVKTDSNGQYSIFTSRPASYPNSDIEAHIHIFVKEPDIANEYYIDEWIFDDDPLLTPAKRKLPEKRGGSGIMKVVQSGDVQMVKQDIILGLNIPDYPERK
ncbi:MAG: intradiol ring-cleavage dioxygenase [Saprospiraceae bacterium]|nr:intradiol ring-cleavage dioxygenase [Saprospiraceae bacterium]